MNLTKISKINIIIYKITKLKIKNEYFWELSQIGSWDLGVRRRVEEQQLKKGLGRLMSAASGEMNLQNSKKNKNTKSKQPARVEPLTCWNKEAATNHKGQRKFVKYY